MTTTPPLPAAAAGTRRRAVGDRAGDRRASGRPRVRRRAAIARWTGQGKRITYCLGHQWRSRHRRHYPRRRPDRYANASSAKPLPSSASNPLSSSATPTACSSTAAPAPRHHPGHRQAKPEIVITGNYRETFGPGMLNQADHIATGSRRDRCHPRCRHRWVFRELPRERGLEPWGGVRAAFVGGSPDRDARASTSRTRSTRASRRSRRTRLPRRARRRADV